MSEFQLYEFVALEKPLDAKSLAYMRDLSSRAHVSATYAMFTYSYGNFPADPLQILAKHYDMLLYVTNWGTRQLAFRFPKGTLDRKALAPYYYAINEIDIKTIGQYDILDITFNDEDGGGEWISDEGQIAPLTGLRDELMRGDLRLLYLAWIAFATSSNYGSDEEEWYDEEEEEDADDELMEPPVPAGLGDLSAPLHAFIEFFEIDKDLVEAAARTSPPLKATKEPIEEWLQLLPATERDDFLLRAAQGETINSALLRRLRQLGGGSATTVSSAPRRSANELIVLAQEVEQQREKRERAQAERARLANLAKLAKREEAAWGEVGDLLALRRGASYDKAVALLAELHQLAVHEKRVDAFSKRLENVIEPYTNSKALLERLSRQGLIG